MSNRFKQLLVRYDEYHKNTVNQCIHIVCIPSVVWSLFLYLHRFSFLNFRLSLILYCSYLYNYWHVSRRLSSRVGVFYALLFAHSRKIFLSRSLSYTRRLAFMVFSLSWIGQFIGHGVFEKNTPALLNGAYSSLLVGPLFAYKHIEDLFTKILLS